MASHNKFLLLNKSDGMCNVMAAIYPLWSPAVIASGSRGLI